MKNLYTAEDLYTMFVDRSVSMNTGPIINRLSSLSEPRAGGDGQYDEESIAADILEDLRQNPPVYPLIALNYGDEHGAPWPTAE